MAYVEEDYVSEETAKLLKDKGFNWECFERKYYPKDPFDPYDSEGIYAPTTQTAMKWLRKVHKLGIFPSTYTSVKGDDIKHVYGTSIVNLDTFEVLGNSDEDDYIFESDSYEETSEKAIRYCLENLI